MAYETEFASALDKKVKDYLTEHAAQQGVDPGTKARMAQAGAADAAAVEAARVPPGGAPAQGAPKPGLGAKLKSFGKAAITPGTYNPNVGALAKGVVKGGAKWGLWNLITAPAFGAVDAAQSSSDEVKKVATMTDNPVGAFFDTMGLTKGAAQPLDYNSFGGRLGANVVNFLQKTGDAATSFPGLGSSLVDRVNRVREGGSFFDTDPPPAAPVPADMQPDGVRRGTLGAPAAASADVLKNPDGSVYKPPSTAEEWQKHYQNGGGNPFSATPESQQGFLLDSMRQLTERVGGARGGQQPATDGRVALGKPEAYGGYIEGPNGRTELSSGTVQRFGVRRRTVGDSFNESLAERREMEKSDVNSRAIEAAARMKVANTPDPKSEEWRLRKQAAEQYKKNNPNDPGGYVSILNGKDPDPVLGKIEDGRGTIIVQRDGKTISADENRNVVEGQRWPTPPPNIREGLRKNRNSAEHRAEFLRRYGPANYEAALK